MKHKHYDTIVAWANGAEIEAKECNGWRTSSTPMWFPEREYRIKPEPVRDVLRDVLIINSLSAGPMLYAATPSEANCVLVFDGTTGKLKECTFKGA